MVRRKLFVLAIAATFLFTGCQDRGTESSTSALLGEAPKTSAREMLLGAAVASPEMSAEALDSVVATAGWNRKVFVVIGNNADIEDNSTMIIKTNVTGAELPRTADAWLMDASDPLQFRLGWRTSTTPGYTFELTVHMEEIAVLSFLVDANATMVQNSRLRWTSNESHSIGAVDPYTNFFLFRNYAILFDGVKFFQYNSPSVVRYHPAFGLGLTNGQNAKVPARCRSMPNTTKTPDYCEWKYAWPNTVKWYCLPGYLKDTFPVKFSAPALSQTWIYTDHVNGVGVMSRR